MTLHFSLDPQLEFLTETDLVTVVQNISCLSARLD